ncbi:DedA family protein [Altererythrobacter salegens]|uniref:DedA family protein n=1 Tax=Croceibacterium salegens TaxID=1737568 RepID=A0A6I4STW0_9SPHN|nr:DedA family protein [Croceibacterium salegens]MXO58818.1 DedA family protein [Croceibacterium salegens]
MHDLIITAIAKGGYLGIFLLMAIENIIPPIPSEVIMGLGGVLVARGQMDFVTLLVVGTAGSTAGNYFWFWIGDKYGYRRLGEFVEKRGRWFTIDFEDVEKAARFFKRHGQWVVFVLRFSPFLRTIVSLPAGLAHMSLWRFMLFTFAGSAIWNALLIEGGRRIAPLYERYQALAGWLIAGLVAAIVAWYVYRVITWKPRETPPDASED